MESETLDNYRGGIMTELIVARHGETAWNVERVFRGTADVDLNEIGVRQAELLGKYLSNWNWRLFVPAP